MTNRGREIQEGDVLLRTDVLGPKGDPAFNFFVGRHMGVKKIDDVCIHVVLLPNNPNDHDEEAGREISLPKKYLIGSWLINKGGESNPPRSL